MSRRQAPVDRDNPQLLASQLQGAHKQASTRTFSSMVNFWVLKLTHAQGRTSSDKSFLSTNLPSFCLPWVQIAAIVVNYLWMWWHPSSVTDTMQETRRLVTRASAAQSDVCANCLFLAFWIHLTEKQSRYLVWGSALVKMLSVFPGQGGRSRKDLPTHLVRNTYLQNMMQPSHEKLYCIEGVAHICPTKAENGSESNTKQHNLESQKSSCPESKWKAT